MKLKKANAILGLLTMAILLIHAGYQVIAYVLFLYDPMVTRILAWATAGVCSLHAVLGMSIVMFCHDGSTAAQYPEANLRTVIQRASAIGMLIHAGYQVTAYVLFLYDPMVTRILAWAVCVFVIGRTYLILASMP